MNITSITDKIIGGKWLMNKKSFYNLYNTIQNVDNIRTGGIKGMLFGNPLITKAQGYESLVPKEEPIEEGNMAIIGISNILIKGASDEACDLLGLTNIDSISMSLTEQANDPSISSICLSFSTPGGETCGIEELGRKIKYIDENIKPVYGWCETQSSSAGYWLMSQTRMIGMTPSSQLGSIGVYMLLLDTTKQLEQNGIKIQPISSGKYKLMGHEFNPLSKEESEILDADVKKQHEKFKSTIISNRPNVKPEAMEGLSYEGDDALELGLTDIVVDSFEEYLNEL